MQGLVDSEKQGEKQKLREKQRGLPEKAILLQIMECLLPIKFNYHNNIFEEKKKVVMSIQPKVSTYKYSNLELFEVCTNFEKYIREDKLELAEESIKIQQTLSQMESLFISSSILKKNQVNFSIYKKEYDKVV